MWIWALAVVVVNMTIDEISLFMLHLPLVPGDSTCDVLNLSIPSSCFCEHMYVACLWIGNKP